MARPMSAEEFSAIQDRVESLADGMVDDRIYDNFDQAMEFSWEMVYANITESTPDELKGWVANYEMDPTILEVSPRAMAEGARFGRDEYDKYLKSYEKHIAPREPNTARLKARLTRSSS